MSSINKNNGKRKQLRKITIMTTGSRGDIQPFVAIGIALQAAGFSVRFLTQPSETHTRLLDDFGLKHVPFGIDVDKFLMEDKEARKSMEQGDTLNFFKCIADCVSDNTDLICKPFYDEFLAEGGKHRPDMLVVSYLNRFFGLYAKHVLKIPAIEIKLQHWVFDDPLRAPMGVPTLPLGMHKLIQTKLMIPQDYKNFQQIEKCLADIIASSGDLKAKAISSSITAGNNESSSPALSTTKCLDDFLLYDQWLESEVNHSPLLPILIPQSPLFKDILHPKLPPSPNLRFVGPAIIETKDQIRGDASSFGGDSEKKKLEDFLTKSDAKRKPLYIGWGSMIRKSPHEMVIFAVKALMMSNQRGIILGGSAGLSMEVLEEAIDAINATNENDDVDGKRILEYAKDNAIFVDKAPHEWLFPQLSLTIHHGGAGTLNAALRAGVPTIVTPVFGDQYDNSFVVQKLGVGVGFEQKLQKIDAKDLSKAIETVLIDPAMAKRAKEVGEQMRNEHGCRAIVEEIENYWAVNVTTGKLFEDIQDWKLTTADMKITIQRKTMFNRVILGSALAAGIVAFLYKESRNVLCQLFLIVAALSLLSRVD